MSKLAQKLQHYRMMEEIGRGGTGTVYRAEHERTGHQVAIKLLNQNISHDEQQVERFYREARLHQQLRHPNIIHFIGLYESGDTLAIVMELLQGCPLKAYLEHHGALSTGELHTVADDILRGLHVAHTRGITHRDIKPSNLFLCNDGQIKIMDFGLAKRMQGGADDITKTALHPVGSYYFMAPEQIIGQKVDARTDLYALGITLFNLATNTLPFEASVGGAFEIMEKQVRHAPPDILELNPDIHPEMVAIMMKLLEKQPNQRFQSCQELAQALQSIPEKTPLSHRGQTTIQQFSDLQTQTQQVSDSVSKLFRPDEQPEEESAPDNSLLWAFQTMSPLAPDTPPLDLNTPLPIEPATLKRLKDSIAGLPPLPAIWQQIQSLLDNPDTAAYDLAKCVEQDSALTAHVLKVCNSAAYRTPGTPEITQVTLALARLGMDAAQDIILQSALPNIGTAAQRHEIEAIHFHTRCLASFARILSSYSHVVERHSASLFAMLHDIGKLVMLHMEPGNKLKILKQRIEQGEHSLKAEWEVLGYTHIDAGMMLALHWKLPRHIHRFIYFHHHPCWHEVSAWPKDIQPTIMLLHTAHIVLSSMDLPFKHSSIWHAHARTHTMKSQALLKQPLKLPVGDEKAYQHLQDEAMRLLPLYPELFNLP